MTEGRGRVIRTSGETLLSLVTPLLSVFLVYIFQAAIVGQYTKRALYRGVKNKYCTPCARPLGLGEESKQHTCYKNWGVGNSSSSREPAIISDGFACSEKMYNVKYAHLIADGNGSVYKSTLENMPYKTKTVEKNECKKL